MCLIIIVDLMKLNFLLNLRLFQFTVEEFLINVNKSFS